MIVVRVLRLDEFSGRGPGILEKRLENPRLMTLQGGRGRKKKNVSRLVEGYNLGKTTLRMISEAKEMTWDRVTFCY